VNGFFEQNRKPFVSCWLVFLLSFSFFYLLAFFYGEAEVVGIVEVTGGAV